MEGAAYGIALEPNQALEDHLDGIIAIIGRAQKPDGYLYEPHIVGVSHLRRAWGLGGMGEGPYGYVYKSHELYNMGHMYEAAVAYHAATGKDAFLKIAEKNAQHVNRVSSSETPPTTTALRSTAPTAIRKSNSRSSSSTG